MNSYLLLSLFIYALIMVGIGIYGYRTSTASVKGYILGGRDMGPKVTALSAGASDMSGWMLMGLPGAVFLIGVEAFVLAGGLLLGALVNYIFVAPKLRVYTEVAGDAVTLPDFFAKRFNEKGKGALRLSTSIIAVVFFTLYTSAGLVAGGKLFESVFNLPHEIGVLTTIGIVMTYTLLGGFKAVSITDFVQGSIMFVALIAVPLIAMSDFDSFQSVIDISSTALSDSGTNVINLGALAFISSVAWGLGYFGQPHILVRFMAIRSAQELPQATWFGMSWMLVSIIGALATGLVGVAYVANFGLQLDDPETIFIRFSEILFHPFISGFLLSAILAAIMSTISSQLLVSSSSLTEDLYKTFSNSEISEEKGVLFSRAAVFLVAVLASILAWNPNNTVLGLVGNAWAGFGSAFGPLILFSLYWSGMTRQGALAGILVGAITVLAWILIPESWFGVSLSSVIYEIVPGFILASLAIVIVSKLTQAPEGNVVKDFNKTKELLTDQLLFATTK